MKTLLHLERRPYGIVEPVVPREQAVESAGAHANNGFLRPERPPRDTYAGIEIDRIAKHQRTRKPRVAAEYELDSRHTVHRTNEKRLDPIGNFIRLAIVRIRQPIDEGEVRPQLPGVAEVRVDVVLMLDGVRGLGGPAQVAGQPQQEIG